MPVDKSKFTHDAYIFKSEGMRRGKRLGYWEKEGYARPELNSSKSPEEIAALFKGQPVSPEIVRRIMAMATGDLFVYLHSTPIGGFDGRVRCKPYGSEPPPEEKDELPQRPAQQEPDDSAGDAED